MSATCQWCSGRRRALMVIIAVDASTPVMRQPRSARYWTIGMPVPHPRSSTAGLFAKQRQKPVQPSRFKHVVATVPRPRLRVALVDVGDPAGIGSHGSESIVRCGKFGWRAACPCDHATNEPQMSQDIRSVVIAHLRATETVAASRAKTHHRPATYSGDARGVRDFL